MYALATLIFVVVLILLLLSNRESSKDERMQIKRLKAERRRRLSLHKNKK